MLLREVLADFLLVDDSVLVADWADENAIVGEDVVCGFSCRRHGDDRRGSSTGSGRSDSGGSGSVGGGGRGGGGGVGGGGRGKTLRASSRSHIGGCGMWFSVSWRKEKMRKVNREVQGRIKQA